MYEVRRNVKKHGENDEKNTEICIKNVILLSEKSSEYGKNKGIAQKDG